MRATSVIFHGVYSLCSWQRDGRVIFLHVCCGATTTLVIFRAFSTKDRLHVRVVCAVKNENRAVFLVSWRFVYRAVTQQTLMDVLHVEFFAVLVQKRSTFSACRAAGVVRRCVCASRGSSLCSPVPYKAGNIGPFFKKRVSGYGNYSGKNNPLHRIGEHRYTPASSRLVRRERGVSSTGVTLDPAAVNTSGLMPRLGHGQTRRATTGFVCSPAREDTISTPLKQQQYTLVTDSASSLKKKAVESTHKARILCFPLRAADDV